MDILRQAAEAYREASQYDYTFHLGSSGRKLTISLISVRQEHFTHVTGLDHLKNTRVFAQNESAKKRVYKNILDGTITIEDIDVPELDEPRAGLPLFRILLSRKGQKENQKRRYGNSR